MSKSGRELFEFVRPLFEACSKVLSILPLKLNVFLLNLFRGVGGKIGLGIRYIIVKAVSKECGLNVSIHQHVFLYAPENLKIGNNVSIHPLSYIDATGGITIGNEVSIAHGTTIMSSTHNYSSTDTPIKYQEISLKHTNIGDNVWIGAKSMILAGVNIEKNTVIGAGAVVTKDIEKESIAVGNPARVIKKRKES